MKKIFSLGCTKPFHAVLFFLLPLLFFSCKKDNNNPKPSDPEYLDLTFENVSALSANIPKDTYNDVSFVTETTGYAVSINGNIVKTTDGGLNWESLSSPVSIPLKKIQFVDAQMGYVIGGDETGNVLLKTSNAGQSWMSMNLNLPEKNRLLSVFFIDKNKGFITGEKLFIKTTDGGQSWTHVFAQTNANFYDVRFDGALTGIATSENGQYYKTTDGGTTWQPFSLNVSTQLHEIYFTGTKIYVRTANVLIDINSNATINLPSAVNKLLFLNAQKCIGIGQHYENGYLPYGDIVLTNNEWASYEQKKYMPDTALKFTAIAKINNQKTIVFSEGRIAMSVMLIKH